MAVVRNLVLCKGAVTVLLTSYALWLHMPGDQIISLALVAVLASVPVALPAMFTLAAPVGARALARRGVLPTSLSAVDEAAGIDTLCADKTGTLTRNELTVMEVQVMSGFSEDRVLQLAALASSDGGQDPVDGAIRAAVKVKPLAVGLALVTFVPFDPAKKSSEATVREADGTMWHVTKGAYDTLRKLAPADASADARLAHHRRWRLRRTQDERARRPYR